MIRRVEALDPRAWILWGAAAGTPPLLGRNPFPVAVVLLAAVAVGAVGRRPETAAGWGLIVRLAVVIAVVGVVFNVLTVRAGDLVIVTIPERVPLLDGALTWNAAVYGLLSGVGLVALVLVGSVVGGAMDWASVVRLLPDRLLGTAVAGSIAFNLIPQTAVAFGEIREAQRARGHRLRSARDLVPLIVPLLNGGIDRAMALAEVLESRGFGSGGPATGGRRDTWLGGALLATTGVAAFAVAVGRLEVAVPAAVAAAALAGLLTRRPDGVVRRTRYREVRLRRADRLVGGAAVLSAAITVVAERRTPGAVTYEPYPSLDAPLVSLPVLVGLLLLFTPVLVLSPAPPQAA